MTALDRYFRISARGSHVGREVRGGITTFLTMAYILLANANILGDAGIPKTAAATSTALAAGVCCILMGLWANFPMALASGMGLNALIAFGIAPHYGGWRVAMGMVVVEGVLILILVLAGLREAILNAIPKDLRSAIGVGIGLFIAVIGLEHGRLIVAEPHTLVTAGRFNDPAVLITLLGLLVTVVLLMWRITGATLVGVGLCTAVALATHQAHWPHEFPRPDFSAMFQADVAGALHWKFALPILSLMLVDFFDTLGTATAVAEEGGLMDAQGCIPRVKQLLAADSVSASVGGLLGASSVTSYIESAAGVAEGARTGLHSVVVGALFLLAIFAAPLAGVIPDYATAPALIVVGFLMLAQVREIDFADVEHAFPAFLTILVIPLTFSIAHGVGYGVIAQVLLSVARGNGAKVHPLLYAVAAAFAAYFAQDFFAA